MLLFLTYFESFKTQKPFKNNATSTHTVINPELVIVYSQPYFIIYFIKPFMFHLYSPFNKI